jgi:hypothetical protein
MIVHDFGAKLSMCQLLKLKSGNLDVDLFGLAQIIHFNVTHGQSRRFENGAISVSKDLSLDVTQLILFLFNGSK